jgi:hypothetical protein
VLKYFQPIYNIYIYMARYTSIPNILILVLRLRS